MRFKTFYFLVFFSHAIYAQKSVTNQNLSWIGLNTTLEINDKWYFQNEIQSRNFVDPFTKHQLLFRGHLHRKFGVSGYEGSLGFCYFLQNSNNPLAVINLTVPEWRPHIEIANKQKIKNIIIDQRYRLEARYYHNTNFDRSLLIDGYKFGNFRFRYRAQAIIPISDLVRKSNLKLKIGDEVMLNGGANINLNVFDQNRLYASLVFEFNPDYNLEFGYINWFQELPDGSFYHRNIAQISFNHKLKLKREKVVDTE